VGDQLPRVFDCARAGTALVGAGIGAGIGAAVAIVGVAVGAGTALVAGTGVTAVLAAFCRSPKPATTVKKDATLRPTIRMRLAVAGCLRRGLAG
jgi:hypothetical protein